MISKVQQIAQEIEVKIKNVEGMMIQSKWKKEVNEKTGKLIDEKTKCIN